MILQMFGSIAGSESLVLAMDHGLRIRGVMAEASHGTAPRLCGKNIANPMAMMPAAAAALPYLDDAGSGRVSSAIVDATIGAVKDGVATVDLAERRRLRSSRTR